MISRIEEAARVLYQCRHPEGDPIGWIHDGTTWADLEWRDAMATAETLAGTGMLATREEWGIQLTNESRTYIAAAGIPEDIARREEQYQADATAVCRYVTEWKEAE